MRAAGLAVALGIFCGAVLAAESPAGKAATKEEVVVSGVRLDDPAEVRKALSAAEDRFYSRFNELNGDDQYDVFCRSVVYTGKRLAERVCEPRFVEDVKRDSSSANMNSARTVGGGNAPMSTSTFGKVNEKYEEFRKLLQRFASEDPVLQTALVERNQLEQAYRALQKK